MIHAYHLSNGLIVDSFSEMVAYKYSYDVYAKANDMFYVNKILTLATSKGFYWGGYIPQQYQIPSSMEFILH